MMYNPNILYDEKDYFTSSNGNIISRGSFIYKPQAVEIPSGRCYIGKDVIIRGDLAAVILNKYCHIESRTVIRPGFTDLKGFRFIPLTIGSHSFIGEDCVVEAAVIGTGCFVGRNCVLSKRCILKDFVYVMDNTVIPPDMVIPPFAIVAGCPAKIVGEQPESSSTTGISDALARYKALKPVEDVVQAPDGLF